ncbi:hypothetical protein [Streptomyces sp. NRRL F-5053]|uniref:hypothetical protein n=1 Tax=Streptomyces sp. NRRL F-5053 TaxID=1463854 RepID=UPI0004C602FE|nr:hypothetical protein [Streptomyces sp. NRRL F-5053]
MSYRTGAYVVDRRRDQVARVMGHNGHYLLLRPPRGGIEWDCPPEWARLASQAELRAAGITSRGTERPEKTTP